MSLASEPAAATTSTNPSPPKSKKQRTSKSTRNSKKNSRSTSDPNNLPGFRKLPVELLAEILLYTESPRDVLAVARCSKYHCDTLTNAGNQFIWKYARQHCKPAPLPDPPKRFTEAAYAAFLFDEGVCEECKEPVKEMMDSFGLRLRLCKKHDCRIKYISATSTIIMHNPALMESHQTFIETLPMLEASNCVNSHTTVKYYPEATPVYRSSHWVTALQDYLEASQTPDTFQRYVEECAIKAEWNIDFLKFCANLHKWKIQYQKAYQENKQFNLRFATELALKHGQTQLDLLTTPTYGALHRNRNKTLEHMCDQDYISNKPAIGSELLRLRERRTRQSDENRSRIAREQIEKHYNRLRATKQLLPLPNLATFRLLPIMRQVQTTFPSVITGPGPSTTLESNLDNTLKSNATTSLLTPQLNEWREKTKKELGETLGYPKEWKDADARKLHPVDRVTARWICRGCKRVSMAFKEDECLDFVGVCGHVCSSLPGEKKSKKARKEKPFKVVRFVKDEKAINAMNKVLSACEINDDDPLSRNLLESVGFRILCTSCDARIVMDANSVIGHSHRHEDMQISILSPEDAKNILSIASSFTGLSTLERGLAMKLLGPTSGSKETLELRMRKGYGCRHCVHGSHEQGTMMAMAAPMTTGSTEGGEGSGDGVSVTASALASASAPIPIPAPKLKKAPAAYTFDGLRSHLKEKHKVGSIRDEDYFYSEQLRKMVEENETKAKRRKKEKEKKEQEKTSVDS